MADDQEAEQRLALYSQCAKAVKAVLVRFAGKQEMATTAESSVVGLFPPLEQVFAHRLKPSKKKGQDPTFWAYVRELLPAEDVAAITALASVTSEAGRGRAWLRMALNEHTLDRTLRKMADEQGIARNYYEPHAYMANEESVSMLATLVQSLSSTIFSLDMDGPDVSSSNPTPTPSLGPSPALPASSPLSPMAAPVAAKEDKSITAKVSAATVVVAKKKKNRSVIVAESQDMISPLSNPSYSSSPSSSSALPTTTTPTPTNNASATSNAGAFPAGASPASTFSTSSSIPTSSSFPAGPSASVPAASLFGRPPSVTSTSSSFSSSPSTAATATGGTAPLAPASSSPDAAEGFAGSAAVPNVPSSLSSSSGAHYAVVGGPLTAAHRSSSSSSSLTSLASSNNANTAATAPVPIRSRSMATMLDDGEALSRSMESDVISIRDMGGDAFYRGSMSASAADLLIAPSALGLSFPSSSSLSSSPIQETEGLHATFPRASSMDPVSTSHGFSSNSASHSPSATPVAASAAAALFTGGRDSVSSASTVLSSTAAAGVPASSPSTSAIHSSLSSRVQNGSQSSPPSLLSSSSLPSSSSSSASNPTNPSTRTSFSAMPALPEVSTTDDVQAILQSVRQLVNTSAATAASSVLPPVSDSSALASTPPLASSMPVLSSPASASASRRASLLPASGRGLAGGEDMDRDAELRSLRAALQEACRARENMEGELGSLREQVRVQVEELAALQAEKMAVQSAHTSAITKFQDVIDEYMNEVNTLSKENLQLKQRLRRAESDAASTSAVAGQGAQAGGAVDGSGDEVDRVVEMYERRMAQMVVMHNELLELNSSLRDQVQDREKQINKLTGRGSQSASATSSPAAPKTELTSSSAQLPRAASVGASGRVQSGAVGGTSSSSGAKVAGAAASGAAAAVSAAAAAATTDDTGINRRTASISSMSHTAPARIPPREGAVVIPSTGEPLVHIWIPTAFLRTADDETFHVYQIYVSIRGQEWNVYRRYSQFRDLHKQVRKLFPKAGLVFPKKAIIGKQDSKLVEARRVLLEQYLRGVITLCLSQPRSPLLANPCKATLCEALPFLVHKSSASRAGSSANIKEEPEPYFGL